MTNPECIIKNVVEALRNSLPQPSSLHEPEFSGNEWKYVKDCLDSGWVSTVGKYVSQFEDSLATFTGAKHAISTVSGTSALHLCLLLAGVKFGDEVIIPSLTFVATANAVSYCSANPHFADCEKKTLGIDANKLEKHLEKTTHVTEEGCTNKLTGKTIKAVICVHTFGHPVDLNGLEKVCKKFKLLLIEDAAESLGSLYKGQHTGTIGTLSALSFNGNKIVTTGGGGAILTNDQELASRAKHLSTTAKLPHDWEFQHDEIGYNYRMPNVNAAIGCAQLEELPRFVKQKRMIANRYKNIFKTIKGVEFFLEPKDTQSNYWLNVLLLEPGNEALRDSLLSGLNSINLMSRPAWTPMHMLKMYQNNPQMDLSVTESLFPRIINIPSSPKLAGLVNV
jgi:perosamine synthetase